MVRTLKLYTSPCSPPLRVGVRNRFQWPSGFKCAVSLTFDDGLPSQLKVAVPLLDRYGVKATFYVNPSAATGRRG